jgi:hypothetical protein
MKQQLLLIIALGFLCGCATFQPAPTPTAEAWPLVQGTSWVYAGTLIRAVGQGRVETNAVRLTCAVLDSQVQRGHLVAKLRNFPLDVSPWEPLPTNAVAVLIRTPAGAFHAMEANQARHVLERLANTKDPLDDLLDVETQVLAWPLRAGQRWGGDAAALQRLDGMYCWQVERQKAERLFGIAGVAWWRQRAIFELIYRTNPEHVTTQFVPGLGLLATDYVHHGTPGEVHLKLVEFQAASETRK